ncbi:tyrosine recombinase XerC [Pseudomonas sp. Pseusp122]|uniref:site-specific integrase n=1 Tax=unclassified Pseudomonas TaxID=196821 RepID=UPI0039A4CBEC
MKTVFELVQEYACTHDLRPATIKTYNSAARAFARHFGDCMAGEVDHRGILEWRKSVIEDGLAKRSWNTYSNHLRTIYDFGIEFGLLNIVKNPFKKTAVIPPKRRKKTVASDAISNARNLLVSLHSSEHLKKQRAMITPAWFWLTVFETFYHTGLRLNALLSVRFMDVDLTNRLIVVRGETEKTHREFSAPIPDLLYPLIDNLIRAAVMQNFKPLDQLFNVNRFSVHYRSKIMNTDQVESMYKKLTKSIGSRMTPHRFRHTIASELMRQPERNIHVTKQLLNHTNIATTMEYIEPDYDFMRSVMNDRTPHFGQQSQKRSLEHGYNSAKHVKNIEHHTHKKDDGGTLMIQDAEEALFTPAMKEPHISVREKVSRAIARSYRPARGKAFDIPPPARVRRTYVSKDVALGHNSNDRSLEPSIGNQVQGQQADNQVKQLAEQMRTPFGLNAWLGRPL